MIEKLDRIGENNRYILARGMFFGPEKINNWRFWNGNELKIQNNKNNVKRQEETTNMKYILEVFGAKAEKVTTWIGSEKFKECKSNTNCYITTDENFFGPAALDKFDAVVFKPGHLRADKVFFQKFCH